MTRFRIDSIGQLARQLQFAPHDMRAAQLSAAEELLHLIEPRKVYPPAFVVYRITGYHPKDEPAALLAGLALQHDLGLLIEQVSESLELSATAQSQPILSITDVCERFSVTSKTIQRWRRRGLPARRFRYPDGKTRVGFLLSSVERFFRAHAPAVCATANLAQADDGELAAIVRIARRLAAKGCCIDEITRRIARRVRRSAPAILHLLKKHDQEHPADALLTRVAAPLGARENAIVLAGRKRGRTLACLAGRLRRPRSAIYRVLLNGRIGRLTKRRMRFIDDPLYHQEDAAQAIRAIVSQHALADEPTREQLRIPRDLPPYLQDLYRTPLLSAAQERALFLKLNFHKYQFVTARRRLDPELARSRELRTLESHLRDIAAVRNDIVRANLRLVASVARRHLRPGLSLMELISDGNIALMRAVDSFDMHRGYRFSTYGTWALMKSFARSVPQMQAAQHEAGCDYELLSGVADRRAADVAALLDRDEVEELLRRLPERERTILASHFGLDRTGPTTYEQLGQRLNVSKERVRQIEQAALAALRRSAKQVAR